MPYSRSRSRSRTPPRRRHQSRTPPRYYDRPRSGSRTPPRRRDRSRSPPSYRDDKRDRSPRRNRSDRPHQKKSTGGFRWKEKRKDDDPRDSRRDRDRKLDNRYQDRDQDRDRSRDRNRDRRRDEDRDQDRDPIQPRRRSPIPERRDPFGERDPKADKPSKEKKPKVSAPAEPMIVIKVNDRLGTTTNVPCLPSDTIGDFKKMVAALIGRDVSRIKLMRQSERPFRDHITLGDYEISNGVQLDLELDTGG